MVIIGVNYAPEPTGFAPYTTSLAESLAARGHRVEVLTTRPHYPAWQVYDGYERGGTEIVGGVTVRRLRSWVPERPGAFSRLLFEVLFGARVALARLPQSDVVLLTSPALFASAIVQTRLRSGSRRHAIWVQDLYGRGVAESGMTDRRLAGAVSRVEGAVLRRADRVITIHPNMRTSVLELGVDPSDVSVVRNWSHLRSIETPGREESRDRLGWPGRTVVVLHAGNMGHKQGLEVVVDAARLADSRGDDVLFVLLGDGTQRGELQSRADGIRSLVFLDPLPDDEYQAAQRAADVLLLCERPGVGSMAVPSKLTSYFATGRPVLASAAPEGNAGVEVLAAGAGLVVTPGDARALLDAALELGSDPVRAAEMGERGLEFRRNFLDEAGAIGAIEAVLADVADH